MRGVGGKAAQAVDGSIQPEQQGVEGADQATNLGGGLVDRQGSEVGFCAPRVGGGLDAPQRSQPPSNGGRNQQGGQGDNRNLQRAERQ